MINIELTSQDYLVTIQIIYLQIFDDHKRCEIDPAKLREGESLDANLVSTFDLVPKSL